MDSVEQGLPQETPVAVEQDKPFLLAHHVSFLLKEADVKDPERWIEFIEPEALTSFDINVQRFLINRWWRALLLSVPEDKILETRNARGCLVDGKWELDTWTTHFKNIVIPCALKHGLLTKND